MKKELSNLQLHMLHLLIKSPLDALKLRNKYTTGFDKMFNMVFSKSFGVEIEINCEMFKDKKYITWRDSNYLVGEHRVKINAIEASLKSEYKCYPHTDGDCIEYAFPVRPQNLHIVYAMLKKIERSTIGGLGSTFDQSSSMHIHIPKVNFNRKQAKKGIPHWLNNILSYKQSFIAPRLDDGDCNILCAAKVLLENSERYRGCHACIGCHINSRLKLNYDYNSNTFKNLDGLTEHISNKILGLYESTLSPGGKFFNLMKDGIHDAEKLYTLVISLLDEDLVNKTKYVIGDFTDRFGYKIDNLLYYFIPYTISNEPINGVIKYNSEFESVEVRLFTGTVDFSLIMLRAMLCNALNQLMVYHDPYLFNLFKKTLNDSL